MAESGGQAPTPVAAPVELSNTTTEARPARSSVPSWARMSGRACLTSARVASRARRDTSNTSPSSSARRAARSASRWRPVDSRRLMTTPFIPATSIHPLESTSNQKYASSRDRMRTSRGGRSADPSSSAASAGPATAMSSGWTRPSASEPTSSAGAHASNVVTVSLT